MQKIAVTGASKLAGTIIERYKATSFRVDDDIPFKEYDVFINNAHVGFCQTTLLSEWFKVCSQDPSKLIINISSRAGLPNLSKGYVYAAQKAALDHLSDNLTYNSVKRCRITTINLGMIEDDLPSLTYANITNLIDYILSLPVSVEIPRVFLQHSHNYQEVQKLKAIKLST